MKSGVEFVEALQVAAFDRRLLVGEILTQAFDRLRRHVGRANRDNLHFEGAAHQHPLLHVLQPDLGDI